MLQNLPICHSLWGIRYFFNLQSLLTGAKSFTIVESHLSIGFEIVFLQKWISCLLLKCGEFTLRWEFLTSLKKYQKIWKWWADSLMESFGLSWAAFDPLEGQAAFLPLLTKPSATLWWCYLLGPCWNWQYQSLKNRILMNASKIRLPGFQTWDFCSFRVTSLFFFFLRRVRLEMTLGVICEFVPFS